jgi:hypothetical protein
VSTTSVIDSLGPAVAQARIHQEAAVAALGQQAAQVQIDPVELVGGVLGLPHHLRHHPEHGAAVELEATVVEGAEIPVTEFHAYLEFLVTMNG